MPWKKNERVGLTRYILEKKTELQSDLISLLNDSFK